MTISGIKRWGFFTPPFVGSDFLAALVANCLQGALPPVDFVQFALYVPSIPIHSTEITSNAKYLCFHEAWLNHEHRIFLYPSELLWSLVHRLLSNPFNLVLILHYINNIPMNAHYKKTSCHFPHSVNIERQKNYMVTGPQNHDCNGCIASTYLYIFFGSFQHQHQSIPCLAYLHTIILSI